VAAFEDRPDELLETGGVVQIAWCDGSEETAARGGPPGVAGGPAGRRARVHIVHGDIARGGHVLVNIRKITGIPFRSLGELVERDMVTVPVADLFAACMRARLSIAVAGPLGSGKTTLLSFTTAELDPSLRVLVAETVFESDIPVPNVAQMHSRRPGRMGRAWTSGASSPGCGARPMTTWPW
jgi:Flp pilus assembly CpaF family ATPase